MSNARNPRYQLKVLDPIFASCAILEESDDIRMLKHYADEKAQAAIRRGDLLTKYFVSQGTKILCWGR